MWDISQKSGDSISSCFFIGHRDAGGSVFPQLSAAVEQHIAEYAVTEFFVGHYGQFDALAARAVKDAKKRHPEVTLTLLLPYHPFDHPIQTPKGFDGTFYPPGMETVPKKVAIVQANRYMVDTCDFLIAYVWHPASNALELTEYAQKKRKMHIAYLPREI